MTKLNNPPTLEWTLTLPSGLKTPIQAPCGIYDALIDEGLLDDPRIGENESLCAWVYEREWLLEAVFCLDQIPRGGYEIVLDGVDTMAEIVVNGSKIGHIDNMFRTWRFLLPAEILCADNTIELRFPPLEPYLKALQSRDAFESVGEGVFRIGGGAWIRKAAFTFGWDWGPKLPAPALWGNIRLEDPESRHLSHVTITQEHQAEGVWLSLQCELQGDPTSFELDVCVRLQGQLVAHQRGTNSSTVRILICEPQLWFPNGLGPQPLYDLTVEFLDRHGNAVDSLVRRIGLRVVRLLREPDEHGESFTFEINGLAFFAKGANWIPMDNSPRHLVHSRYENLLQSAVDANMNMLRVWGGGIFEMPAFYEICDEKGLLLWHDLMFACSPYPVNHADFRDNTILEVRENIKRLHHHASLALWCGNNEIEMWWIADVKTPDKMSWANYQPFFDRNLQEIAAECSPGVPYWPGSPHTPLGNRFDFNNAGSGDAHIWDVWFNRQDFSFYRTCPHRFVSEFGFQSLPHPDTLAEAIPEGSRNISSRAVEKHQRSQVGNSAMIAALLDWFQLPTRWDRVAIATQIVQALANKVAVEHWRRLMPRCMGALYWQLNDCWAAPSWSSIDYRERWKASHYEARRFFAPLLVSILEESGGKCGHVWVTNDSPKEWLGTLTLSYFHSNGQTLSESKLSVACKSMTSRPLIDFSLEVALSGTRLEEIFFCAALHDATGQLVSNAWHTALPPKHMNFAETAIQIDKTRWLTDQEIVLSSECPQMFVWMSEGVWDDAFFHLSPGRPKTLKLRGTSELAIEHLSALTHLSLSA